MKIIIVRARPGPKLWYFLFSHRAQGKWASRLYALSKALIAFRFCTRIGPKESQVLPCAPARNNVSIPSYRVRKTAAPKRYALPSRELLFPSCPHWHQFVVREAVYKWWKFQSVPSENYKVMSIRRSLHWAADFHTPITRYRNIVAGGCAWQYLGLCLPYPRAKYKSNQSLTKRVQPLSPFALGPMGKQEIS